MFTFVLRCTAPESESKTIASLELDPTDVGPSIGINYIHHHDRRGGGRGGRRSRRVAASACYLEPLRVRLQCQHRAFECIGFYSMSFAYLSAPHLYTRSLARSLTHLYLFGHFGSAGLVSLTHFLVMTIKWRRQSAGLPELR